jgi:hypothetical protein
MKPCRRGLLARGVHAFLDKLHGPSLPVPWPNQRLSTRLPISFRSALARFNTERAEFGELTSAQRDHLARWADDDRAERFWKKIQSLAWGPIGSYDPLDGFIAHILVAKSMADMVQLSEFLIERHRERSARHLERACQLEALAKAWMEISGSNHPNAELALKRAKQHEEEAKAWRKLAQKPLRRAPFLISRIDKSGSRKQRAFMQLVGEYIIDLCGRPLDSEIAMLNDIAFDTTEATNAYQARSARRSTTRKGRRPKARFGKRLKFKNAN